MRIGSTQYLMHNPTSNIRQTERTTVMFVSQFLMVNTHKVEECRVQVIDCLLYTSDAADE